MNFKIENSRSYDDVRVLNHVYSKTSGSDLTARDPTSLFRPLTADESKRAIASQQDWANRMYDRALCEDYPSLTPCDDIWKNPETSSGPYMADTGGTTYSGSFDPGVPVEKQEQRCCDPLCAFYADGSQTKAWARARPRLWLRSQRLRGHEYYTGTTRPNKIQTSD